MARRAPAGDRWEDLLGDLRPASVGPSVPRDRAGLSDRALDGRLAAADLGAFLRAAAGAGGPLTVVINDPHRAAASRPVLDALMRAAGRLRLAPRWRLLVATGSHTFGAYERRRHEARALGPWAGRFGERAWHEAGGSDLVTLGRFRLNRRVVEETFTLAIGTLEPHYFAGVTGAHKTLTVGLMSDEDLRRNHEAALSERAAPMLLDGNPVFEGIVEALRLLEADGRRLFAINLVAVGDRIVGCAAGRPMEALREGLPLVRRVFVHPVPRRLDLIVARVAPPLDRSLYQADKGIKNVEGMVRDGGLVILEAPCRDGVGPDRFMRLLERAPDHRRALALVAREGYRLGDHKAVRLRRLTGTRGVRLGIVSAGLPEAAARTLRAERFGDRPAAASWALRVLGGRRGRGRRAVKALIVEDAGNVALEAPPARRGVVPRGRDTARGRTF